MKYIIFSLFIIMAIFQFGLLIKQVSGTKFVQIEKVDGISLNKSFKLSLSSEHEDAVLKIEAKNVFDTIFITNQNGNILSLIFKIISILFLGLLLYKLADVNLLNREIFILFRYSAIALIAALAFQYFGLLYTKKWLLENTAISATGFNVKGADFTDSIMYLVMVFIINYLMKNYKRQLNKPA